jgi:hypothetical protein
MQIHIDHIDPRWEKGRDYQLVCGLDSALNFCERDPDFNVSKNNRFLPWRVAEDEIGTIPVNQGDICQFLDLKTGEWVLEEFLGSWWFEQTKELCGTFLGGQVTGYRNRTSGRMREVQKLRPIQDLISQGKRIGMIAKQTGQIYEAQKKANKTKFICLVTGKVTTSGPLAQWQRKRGIDTSLKIKFETFTFLIKSLCLTSHLRTAKKL